MRESGYCGHSARSCARVVCAPARAREKETFPVVACRRAERRAGELLAEMRENGERVGGPPERESPAATLSDLKVSKWESSRWMGLAPVPLGTFEAAQEPLRPSGLYPRVYPAAVGAAPQAERAGTNCPLEVA